VQRMAALCPPDRGGFGRVGAIGFGYDTGLRGRPVLTQPFVGELQALFRDLEIELPHTEPGSFDLAPQSVATVQTCQQTSITSNSTLKYATSSKSAKERVVLLFDAITSLKGDQSRLERRR
jgi:hypothetical protein